MAYDKKGNAQDSDKDDLSKKVKDSEDEITKNVDDAEKAAAEGSQVDSAEANESEKLRPLFHYDPEDYKNKVGGKFRFKLASRKRTTAGIAAVGVLGSLFYAFGVVQGPFEAIHYAKLLEQFHSGEQEDFMDGRTGRFMRGIRAYMSTGAVGAAARKSRLGIRGNRVADKWERRLQNESGLRSVHDDTTGRFMGYEVIDREKSITFLGDLDLDADLDVHTLEHPPGHAISFDGEGHILQHIDGPFIDLRNLSFRARRGFVRIVTEGTHTKRLAGRLGARTLIKRYGIDFHPRKGLTRKATDNIVDWIRDRLKEKAEKLKNGTDPPDPGRLSGEDTDEDGAPDHNTDIADEGNEIIEDAIDVDTPEAKKGLINRLVKGGGAIMAVISTLCIIRDFDEQIQTYQFEAVTKVIARMGGDRVTTGNQAQTGVDTTTDELEVESDLFFDNNTNMGWVAGRSIQANLGQPQTGPDAPEDAKPGNTDETPWLFRTVGSMTFLGPICGAQDILEGVPIVGDAIRLSDSAGQAALDAALSVAGTDIATLYSAVVSFFGKSAADVFAEGPIRGVMEDTGWRWAMNDAAMSTAAVAMSDSDAAILKEQVKDEQRIEQEHKSYYARLFDLKDPNSMVATMMRDTPDSPGQTFATLFSAPARLFSKMFTPASAQAVTAYDYDFPKFGFTAAEQNDERVQEPFDNAAVVEYDLDLAHLNEEFGEPCFGMQIDPETNGLIFGEGKNPADVPDRCRTDDNHDGVEDNEQLLRYRFYIADNIAETSLSCYEGDEDACDMLIYGMDQQQNDATPGLEGGEGINPEGFHFPLITTKGNITSSSPAWCSTSPSNCHHDYNAADIFAPTGTHVIAARGGRVVRAADHDDSAVGSRVAIVGDDGNLYYYAHMGDGTISVSVDEQIAAGTKLGEVGTSADAMGTSSHLHFDILPPGNTSRPNCSGAECAGYPFINPQPVLISAFNALP